MEKEMSPEFFRKRHAEVLKFIEAIWNQEPINFSDLTPSMLKEEGAVYLIALKETDEVLYVGRTVNVRRRLYTNHLMGNHSTARLKKYLVTDENLPEIQTYQDAKDYIIQNCYFKYLPVDDWRLRGYIEGSLLYPLKVRYVEKEH